VERACRAGDEATAVSSIFSSARVPIGRAGLDRHLGGSWPGRPIGQKSQTGPVLFCDSIHRGQVPEEREPGLAETAICLASVRALISERDSAGCG
jgi:hypothetical protein